VKHGLYAKDLRQSVIRLGEDVGEYDEHLRRFVRAFVPQDEVEGKIVLRLGEAAWRLMRVYRARAAIMARDLQRLLERDPPPKALTGDETRLRAVELLTTFLNEGRVQDRLVRLQSHMERLLRLLLSLRTGGKPGFKLFARSHPNDWKILVGVAPGTAEAATARKPQSSRTTLRCTSARAKLTAGRAFSSSG
jgi:hypothetical protein